MSSTAAVAAATVISGGYVRFLPELERALSARSMANESCGMLVVHLANLNRIHTSIGYEAGQRLSSGIAAEFQKILRDEDWLTQLTVDRFVMVLGRIRNPGHLLLAANKLAQMVSDFSATREGNAMLEVRLGAALFPEHGDNAGQLLRNAELAVEAAVRSRASYAVFKPEASQQITEDWELESQIEPGIGNGEFQLLYQPKLDARTLLPCGVEALMRWRSSCLGNVSPDRFIPLAELSGSIDSLTSFALHSAARDASAWHASCNLGVAVNLSPSVLDQGNIVDRFRHVAAIWGIDVKRLTAEVTENGVMASGNAALRTLQELRDAGVRVSIDDFGTGNSSLAYFKDIPADELKIDKSFIFAMLDNDANDHMVRTIIELAHGFRMQVVAEGVENAEAVTRLRELGCDVLQGYHFSRPLPQEELMRYLERSRQESAQ